MKECAAAPSRDFAAAAENLLNTLGYRSRRKAAMFGKVADFMHAYPDPNNVADTKSAKQLRAAADNVNIIFQFAKSEIDESVRRGEMLPNLLLSPTQFQKSNAKSFLFVAVDLRKKKGGYSRSKYADLVREINKRFKPPTVVLFRRPASDDAPSPALTLGFVDRRKSQTRPGYDVLQKVSLLREIQCDEPHRGHLDILDELSLAERFIWIERKRKLLNFDGLLAAWLDKLDAEALNRRFYKALYRWFEWARDKAVFPCPPSKSRDKAEAEADRDRAAADSVIRLITRMMFIWFIKEKKLVAEDLFYEEDVSPLLANYDAVKGDTYYRAILQNLFFATLNTKMEMRGFNPEGQPGHRGGHGYRYKTLMADSDKILELMDETPFINGGLFDCLDSLKAGGFRADMFSDPDPKKWEAARKKAFAALSVPNFLFFQDKKDPKEQRGLLTIFKKYKFTVEENTPVEQEVALDPELLGKVFENLLAEVNPETRESARKQTGSFYTPRAVVDYMTDESLVAYLATKVPGDPGDRQWRQKLRDLFDYAKNECESIAKNKIAPLVGAIADIKVLDPACGSGAFPMGVLNKLAWALSKLDSKNKEWKKLQKKRAASDARDAFYGDYAQDARALRLKEINDTFEHYSKPFGRKLFLIQNSIFGADIQPIACQIAKLRFFISLAIEQEKDESADNFGIRQLPNLETRFVAADTLIGIGGVKIQDKLGGDKIRELQKLLAQNRERYFHAGVRNDKIECQNEDERLRGLLAKELARIPGLEPAARGVAAWNPYDQNAVADWFDSEWMFGVKGGFDVVIGNPPYIQLQRGSGKLSKKYKRQKFASFDSFGDIYMLFCEKGLSLLDDGGGLTYIISNSWMLADSGSALRGVLTRNNPRLLINTGKDVFENTYVDTNILMMENATNRDKLPAADVNRGDEFPPSKWVHISPKGDEGWVILSPEEQKIFAKMKEVGTPIKEWDVNIDFGVKTGRDEAFVIDEHTKRQLCKQDPKSSDILMPLVKGREIGRYAINFTGLHLITIEQGWTNANRGRMPAEDFMRTAYPAVYEHLCSFANNGLRNRQDKGDYWWELRPCSYYPHFHQEKLMWIQLVSDGRFALDTKSMYPLASVFVMTGESIHYLLALLNSNLVNWCMRNISPTSGMGVLQWKKTYVGKLPIPRISEAKQRPFVALAQKITAAKAVSLPTSTCEMEGKIDALVYKLYGLTSAEIALMEKWKTTRRRR